MRGEHGTVLIGHGGLLGEKGVLLLLGARACLLNWRDQDKEKEIKSFALSHSSIFLKSTRKKKEKNTHVRTVWAFIFMVSWTCGLSAGTRCCRHPASEQLSAGMQLTTPALAAGR